MWPGSRFRERTRARGSGRLAGASHRGAADRLDTAMNTRASGATGRQVPRENQSLALNKSVVPFTFHSIFSFGTIALYCAVSQAANIA